VTASKGLLRRRGVVLSAVLLVCAVSGYFALGWGIYYWKEYTHHYEAGAVSSLFALHTMQENYKKDHGSYAGTFSQLGVPSDAKLDSDVLTWDGPYHYRIIEVVENQHGTILEYFIDARPTTYARGSKRSYLMDQDGTIYFTSANRNATKRDRSFPFEP
jgi:hypothetical protein